MATTIAVFYAVIYGEESEDILYFPDKEIALQKLGILSKGHNTFQPIVSEFTLCERQFKESDEHWLWDPKTNKPVSVRFHT